MRFTIPMWVTVDVKEPTAVRLATMARVLADERSPEEAGEVGMGSMEDALIELIDPGAVLFYTPGLECVSTVVATPLPGDFNDDI